MKKIFIKNNLENIDDLTHRIEEGKTLVDANIEEIRKLIVIAKDRFKHFKPGEMKDLHSEALENFQSVSNLISEYGAELQNEILRVKEASSALETQDIDELKNAFKKFVATDAAYSVKNISMALYDWKESITGIKNFIANTPEEET